MPDTSGWGLVTALFLLWAPWLSYTVIKIDRKLTGHLAFHAGEESAERGRVSAEHGRVSAEHGREAAERGRL